MKRTTLLALGLGFCLTAQAADPIKLGLNYPRTGPYKEEGLSQMRGALLAIDEINQRGGVLGRPLELISRNTASRPEKAVVNVDRLADEGAAMLFGGVSSAVAISAGKRARERGLLYFGTITYSNDTTGRDGHRYMFRESTSAWMSARVLGQYLNKTMPGKNYFYITADYTWGHTSESSLRQATNTMDQSKHPGVKTPFPNARLSDFRQALKQAEQSGADVLALVLYGEDMVRAMRIADELGLNKKMQIAVPNLSTTMVESAGPDIMRGVLGSEPWTWRVPEVEGSERGKAFVKSFSETYQVRPSSSAAIAYTIVNQWADAVERARSLDSEKLIAALENHRYTLLKDEQYWRDFDHQSVQTVYALRVKQREEVLKDKYRQDYFEIVHRLSGDVAAPSLAEWQEERRSANQPLQLQ
ncbi:MULTISPECIES: substrate-binding protein [Pseudomonadaceae]|jgi:branched-chain amino acid transport system substrate-binding protein|uniref:Branched chain amino-acid ABC transporter substrate-binding protein n=1 Tax=Pseudomonas saudiphocaensis TaxID=1499686 RepID=A0A078M017_9PSED|nr:MULTISPECIES: substrate-binding protein [Pseudomonadaceae]MBE7928844.1 substrate-binding protein [Pseudomonas saudiphocaensis]MCF6782271.1 substrate-binding protein [Stutzerimonas stutzeri]MCF6805407.1 substrate-binding protein [Stutzerimonas stutzeri]CDZ95982.1 branched chain amino-acid ABC transporter substrate-binding protein [Pseudomonas saudiphocaensis]